MNMVPPEKLTFEWDLAKESANVRKHRITFTEAIESFSDLKGFVLVDESHSGTEARYYWVGKSASGRVLTTRYTRRGETIRIIGWAEWRKFQRLYEATKAGESETE